MAYMNQEKKKRLAPKIKEILKRHKMKGSLSLAFLSEVIPAMNEGNHDNSDIMTDYFDVGWYISVNIGRWDKPYIVRKYN